MSVKDYFIITEAIKANVLNNKTAIITAEEDFRKLTDSEDCRIYSIMDNRKYRFKVALLKNDLGRKIKGDFFIDNSNLSIDDYNQYLSKMDYIDDIVAIVFSEDMLNFINNVSKDVIELIIDDIMVDKITVDESSSFQYIINVCKPDLSDYYEMKALINNFISYNNNRPNEQMINTLCIVNHIMKDLYMRREMDYMSTIVMFLNIVEHSYEFRNSVVRYLIIPKEYIDIIKIIYECALFKKTKLQGINFMHNLINFIRYRLGKKDNYDISALSISVNIFARIPEKYSTNYNFSDKMFEIINTSKIELFLSMDRCISNKITGIIEDRETNLMMYVEGGGLLVKGNLSVAKLFSMVSDHTAIDQIIRCGAVSSTDEIEFLNLMHFSNRKDMYKINPMAFSTEIFLVPLSEEYLHKMNNETMKSFLNKGENLTLEKFIYKNLNLAAYTHLLDPSDFKSDESNFISIEKRFYADYYIYLILILIDTLELDSMLDNVLIVGKLLYNDDYNKKMIHRYLRKIEKELKAKKSNYHLLSIISIDKVYNDIFNSHYSKNPFGIFDRFWEKLGELFDVHVYPSSSTLKNINDRRIKSYFVHNLRDLISEMIDDMF